MGRWLTLGMLLLLVAQATHAQEMTSDEAKRLAAENAALRAELQALKQEVQRLKDASVSKPATNSPKPAAADTSASATELQQLRAQRDTLNQGLFNALNSLNRKLAALPANTGTSVQNQVGVAANEEIKKSSDFDNYRMAILARVIDVQPGNAGSVSVKITGIEPLVPFADAKPQISFQAVPGYSSIVPASFGYSALMTIEQARLIQKDQPVLIIVNQTIYEYTGPSGYSSTALPCFAYLNFASGGMGRIFARDYVLQIGDRLYDSPWRHQNAAAPRK